ncbi:MAG: hypothetical protein JSS99_14135 [Actinobacteria bacterium]|nr:hypothetical protein [Actinomycetota bacterium]
MRLRRVVIAPGVLRYGRPDVQLARRRRRAARPRGRAAGAAARPGAGVARRLRLPHHVRGRVAVRRPVRLARAAAQPAAAAPRAARRGPARPLDRRGGRRRRRRRAGRPHALRPRGRRARDRAALPRTRVRLRVARGADAAARARRARGRGRAVPPLRAGAVRRLVHAERALEAAARPARAVRRRAELRSPARAHAGRLPLRAGVGHPHRGRRHELLPPGQREPDRRSAARRAGRRVPRRRRRPRGHAALLAARAAAARPARRRADALRRLLQAARRAARLRQPRAAGDGPRRGPRRQPRRDARGAAAHRRRPPTRRVSALQRRFQQARGDERLALLEGFHALKHALRFGAEVELVAAADPDALERLAAELAPDLAGRFRALAAEPVPAELLATLVPRAPRTRVVALARRPPFRMPAAGPVVLLEDPRDLGNVGAVVRVAAAADAAAVLTTGMHDPWDPAALRGAAGLHFALPVGRAHDAALAGRPLLALDPDGEPLDPARLPADAVLAFGTERHGLSDALLARADARLRLPMRPGVSSLNLATAVAAVLFAWRLSGAGGEPAR